MGPHAFESALVYGVVVACAAYSLHRLLPRPARQALRSLWARGLLRLAGPGRHGWQRALRRLAERGATTPAGTGCGSCDHCGLAPGPDRTTAQPVSWHPPRPR